MTTNSGSIFVLYHRGLRTGGPEALHQLVDMLRELGQDAYLVPHPHTAGNDRVEQYGIYDAPEAPEIIDSAENVVVYPETYVHEMSHIKQARRMCWWLSIDNSLTFMAERMWYRNTVSLFEKAKEAAVPFARMWKNGVTPAKMRTDKDVIHLVQSSYAWAFVATRLDVVPSLVSDYTPTREFQATATAKRNRQLVTYNPAKGGHIIDAVKAASPPTIEWQPIVGMTRAEVVATLQQCGVYLDLGHHPGKDRMPREATLSGALTIVARRGSGAFYADVPIPWEHKITPGDTEVATAAAMLPQLIANFEQEVAKQASYRETILNERSRFKREVEDVFVNGRLGKDAYDYV
ncbi:hypothetical protein NMQ03_13720 [Arthrobacter sp. DNA4]|uniref:hypothetical protein n=1 Tax=Arthrobacter sp. DNA4 TaxID=2963432 RepID=UPI0020CC79CB|nr:hypothetical protein [Arthrobacter sp. DNA4]UTT68309.1 hypothetical protein NMQ03_13720 [Arthrobacter sp. DNA4]